MLVPYRHDRFEALRFKESYIPVRNKFLMEELGSFHNQYDVAKLCVGKALEMHKDGVNRQIIDTSALSDEIKQVELHITPGGTMKQAEGFDMETRKAIVKIGELNLTSPASIKQLPNAICHELMHCNVFLKRYFSNVDPFDLGGADYTVISQMIKDLPGGYAYDFAYALYSTNYQEVNAFVSQTSGEIMDSGWKGITKKEFVDLYKQTNSVIIFNSNIKLAMTILRVMNDQSIERSILTTFRRYGVEMSVPEIKAACRRIIRISREALKDCARNAVIAYEKLTDK